ncbi:peptide-methionine (R)-S-oxide reductase MsrB [Pseudomonadota bacterium]
MKRRAFIQLLGVGSLILQAPLLFANQREIKAMITRITKSRAEWEAILTAEQFHILRDEGTESPHSSPLNKEYRDGIYHCAGCDLELFNSDMKFDSGTGWPSFFTSIEGHLETKRDFKMVLPRTEYHCTRCGGHQGHVFNDGPEPTGERWCNNGVALRFEPAD